MSAQAFGAKMPTHVTLDDVASMAAADENNRYELSPEGVLSVMPPADPENALLVMRMIFWLASHGFEAEQIAADCGIDVGGGRVPDLTVWAKGMPPRPIELCRHGRPSSRCRGGVRRVRRGRQDHQEGRVREGRHPALLDH